MKVVLQRVSQGEVSVEGNVIGKIAKGFVLLVGIAKGDTLKEVETVADKISKLRIFEDNEDRMNLSLADVGGSILSISQFTLLANTKKGNRPSFMEAALPEEAIPLYEGFNQRLRDHGFEVATGKFGAHMEVSLVNDGPVTIVFDSKN